LIAHAFPPSGETGGSRIAHLCKYLPEFGVQPVILTVQNRFHEHIDRTFLASPSIRVIRTAQHKTPLDWYAQWQAKRSPDETRADDTKPNLHETYRLSRRLRHHLLSVLLFPDRYQGWYFPATRTARHLLRKVDFDVVFSTAPPYIAHLIARSLKRQFKIPWIADFRDPWVNNEVLLSSYPKWYVSLSARMEANCVRAADLVISNTDWQHRVMCERYPTLPRERFVTLTNGFDNIEAPASLDVNKHKPLCCLHLGDIYQGRRIDTFCAGLSILVKERKLDPNSVKVLFLGYTEQSQIEACRKIAGELVNSGMIEFQQRVGKEEARRRLWEADLLLIFQGGYRAQVPLKFYEYLSTGKPVFAVAEPGALSELISHTGVGLWTGADNPREIAEKFLVSLTLPAKPAEVVQDRWAAQFHFRSLSRRLATWIRKLQEEQKGTERGRTPNS